MSIHYIVLNRMIVVVIILLVAGMVHKTNSPFGNARFDFSLFQVNLLGACVFCANVPLQITWISSYPLVSRLPKDILSAGQPVQEYSHCW